MVRSSGLIYTPCKLLAGMLLSAAVATACGQVIPSEVANPRARAAESKYLPQLESLQQQIGTTSFPFPFQLTRYLNAKSGRAAVDRDGLEFVNFQHRIVLKVSGVYKAAFEAGLQTENVRATRVLEGAGIPLLRMTAQAVPDSDDYDAIGLEILYNTRDTSNEYSFEGREVLSAVFTRADALAFANATSSAARQEILNRSDVYVNGQPLGVALGQHDPIATETKQEKKEEREDEAVVRAEAKLAESAKLVRASASHDLEEARLEPPVVIVARDVDSTSLHHDLTPVLEHSGEQAVLRFSLENSLTFNGANSSIYKRAAQSFDLFLAPELRALMRALPTDAKYDAFEFSIVNQVANAVTPSETIDFICPITSTRSFLDNKITSQDLINQSTVLVNGMRIGLDLAKVE
jgi:hypothetical protein